MQSQICRSGPFDHKSSGSWSIDLDYLSPWRRAAGGCYWPNDFPIPEISSWHHLYYHSEMHFSLCVTVHLLLLGTCREETHNDPCPILSIIRWRDHITWSWSWAAGRDLVVTCRSLISPNYCAYQKVIRNFEWHSEQKHDSVNVLSIYTVQ